LQRKPGLASADGFSVRSRFAYHLDGVKQLVVNADVLAKIFSGWITDWNDPAIVKLNPGVTLPDTRISPIYRSDSSGTTDNFQKYLVAGRPE